MIDSIESQFWTQIKHKSKQLNNELIKFLNAKNSKFNLQISKYLVFFQRIISINISYKKSSYSFVIRIAQQKY